MKKIISGHFLADDLQSLIGLLVLWWLSQAWNCGWDTTRRSRPMARMEILAGDFFATSPGHNIRKAILK